MAADPNRAMIRRDDVDQFGQIVAAPARPFELLDVYSDEGTVEAEARPDWLAVISAGRKVKHGDREIPQVSRDGTIYVSGDLDRCPALIDALEATDNKRLTIFFPYDDLESFILQRFTRRSATALEVYGDGSTLTEITTRVENGKPVTVHDTHVRGSVRYKELLKTCKVETHVLFGLARWDGTQAVCTFPDGYGWYAIRFTSRNSARSLAGRLQEIKERVTRGRLAGLPFELSLAYRDVAAPDGKTRNVPVWCIEFKPPMTLELTSGNFRDVVVGALAEGERLRLPAPPVYTLMEAAAEDPDLDLDVAAFTDDPPCDANYWRGVWYVATRDTELASDDARHAFVAKHTRGAYASLERFLEHASEQEASDLIVAVGEALDEPVRERIAAVLQRSPKLGDMQRRMDDADYYARESIQARREPEAPKVIDHEPETTNLGPEPTAAKIEPTPEPSAKPKDKEAERRSTNIHILVGSLGWDDPTYRLALRRTFGADTSTTLTKQQADGFASVLAAEVQLARAEDRSARQPHELEGLRALGWTDDPSAESGPLVEAEQPSLLGAALPTEGDEREYQTAMADALSLIADGADIDLVDCERDGETTGAELRGKTERLRKRIDAAVATRGHQAARR